jgi:3-hydroxybutyryl-CoA dehydrogenase
MTYSKIGVVGLGIMGAGIVEVFARSGFEVFGTAESEAAVEVGRANLAKSLGRAVSKGKLSQEESDQITSRVNFDSAIESLADCDLVIEAAPEILSLKTSIFEELDRVVKASAILATNTSSLSVTQIAKATNRPKQVVGLHFFNPAPVQDFVEVIGTELADPQIVASVTALGASLGKRTAQVTDQPGFIVNKLLLRYLNHAVQILDSGEATKEQLDSAMREYAKYPMGPCELLDLVGIDTCVEIMKTIHADTGLEIDLPAAGMVDLVSNGNKGRKTGFGFYNYAGKHEAPVDSNEDVKSKIHNDLLTAYLGDCIAMEASGYASREDIDAGMKLGCGLPEGPFEVIERLGINKVREQQAELAHRTGITAYQPLPL